MAQTIDATKVCAQPQSRTGIGTVARADTIPGCRCGLSANQYRDRAVLGIGSAGLHFEAGKVAQIGEGKPRLIETAGIERGTGLDIDVAAQESLVENFLLQC